VFRVGFGEGGDSDSRTDVSRLSCIFSVSGEDEELGIGLGENRGQTRRLLGRRSFA